MRNHKKQTETAIAVLGIQQTSQTNNFPKPVYRRPAGSTLTASAARKLPLYYISAMDEYIERKFNKKYFGINSGRSKKLREIKNKNLLIPAVQMHWSFPFPPIEVSHPGTAEDIFRRVWEKTLFEKHRSMYVLFLDDKWQLLCWRHVCTGSLRHTKKDQQVIKLLASYCSAKHIMVAVNKPGEDDPCPNREEELNYYYLKIEMGLVFCDVEDYIIIGRKSIFSFSAKTL